MRIPLLLMALTCAIVLVLGAVAAGIPTPTVATVDNAIPIEQLYKEFGDPLPVTKFNPEDAYNIKEEPAFPKEEHLRLIGRITPGIIKIAHKKGGGRWWECGKVIDPEDEQDRALEWAYRIVFLAWEFSDNGSDDGITVNPWGISGIAANESGFDICALGPWPRKWGYEHKTIKRRKLCISHPFSEIKTTMLHPKGIERWKTSGIDAAPLHQLWRCNEKGMCRPKWNREKLPAIPLADVFSLGKGFEYNVRKMKKDSIDFKTERPWLYWPGHYSKKYDEKVVRWAKIMGATDDEI